MEEKKRKHSTFGLGSERQFFVENLSVLLSSGMDISTALNAIKEEIKSSTMKAIIDDLDGDIKAGSPLWKALDSTGLLSPHVISLIRIGEETGRLSENLKAISLQEQKETEFRSKVTSAMLYPMFVFGLTIIIGVGISWFILPRLSTVFASLNIPLPLITRALIAVGTFLGLYGFIAVPVALLVLLLLVYFIFIFKKTNVIGQYIMLSFGPVRRLIQEVELSRMGFILGTLLSAGLPIVPALESLSQATDFHYFKKFYVYLKNSIEEGNSFQQSFKEYKNSTKIIPVSIQQLIVSGEQSGHLPETFFRLGEMYEAKTDISTKNLTVLLEPILLVIVWLGVVGVAMAVILPLYSLVGGLNATTSAPPPPPVVAAKVTFTPTPLPKNRIRILENNQGYVNVRDLPGLNGKIVGRLDTEETYTYSETQNNWYKVATGAAALDSAWVFGDLVEVLESGSI